MEENLNELIKIDNATIGTFGTIQKPKPIKSKIIKPKPVFGTKEWADRSENCLDWSEAASEVKIRSRALLRRPQGYR